MVATVVVSTSAIRRVAFADVWLKAREPGEEVCILGGSRASADDLVRRATKGATFGWHRLSLTQLAATVAAPRIAERGIAPLSRLGLEALTARIVHEFRARDRLGRYQAIGRAPGLASALCSVFVELRLAGISAGVLATEAPDLATLFEAYAQQLEAGRFIDWPGVLQYAAEAIDQSGVTSHPLVGLPTVLLDVPISSRAEREFLGALARVAPEIVATVPAADATTLAHLQEQLDVSTDDLDGAANQTATSITSLQRLQRHLFNDREHSGDILVDDSCQIFSAPGEGRECVEIARRVLGFARTGVPFDSIAVLLRTPESYRSHIEEAFGRAGVPAHFVRGAVQPDPAGRAFLALLRCAAEGLSASRFAEYLSLGQVPDASADGEPPAEMAAGDRWVPPGEDLLQGALPGLVVSDETDVVATASGDEASGEAAIISGQLRAPRRWERILVDAAVIGGADRWHRRFAGLRNDLAQRIRELASEDETAAEGLKLTLTDLEALSRFSLPLIDDLAQLPSEGTWGDWLDRLTGLATRALRQPDRVLAVLSELAPMASVGPVSLGEVLQTLQKLLLEIAVPPSSGRYGKVFVGPIEAARGLSFGIVFVPGLAEKMFPTKIVEDPILLDAVRERLGTELATNQMRIEQERLALALAAGAAAQHLCVSYPRLDLEQGRPRVPSFYGLEAVRAAEARLPDFTEFAERAETSTSTRLGWPAPSDPAEAIDDAEHDLAVLGRLVDRSEEAVGAARYLLFANPHLARALRARYQRWGRNWTTSDGMTSRSEAAKEILAHHALGIRSYSPTALQNYAYCPYRFFLQAIHRLAPRELPEAIDELDPLQRGSLVHDVQFALFTRLTEKHAVPVRPANLAQARKVLDSVIDEFAEAYRDELSPAIDRVWEDGISGIRADLREWLRRASEDDSGYAPWHFELSFGLENRHERRLADPDSLPGAVDLDCGIQLRGSIDLVERRPSGEVRVTDHKTGKPSGKSHQAIDGGKSLQPLFYALAAEKIFRGEAKVVEGRLYFCTSRGGFADQVVTLDEETRGVAAEVAETIGDAISHPFMPVAPEKGACQICDYRVVCGPYEELRVRRKPEGSLEPLLSLRSIP